MTLSGIKKSTRGYVFDIQGLSVHDGPGCRTLIFLNGCTLNCEWCSNPEGISLKPSLMYFPLNCIACENCIKNCDHNAIRLQNKKLIIDRANCVKCTEPKCLKECYTNALKISGYQISASEVFNIIQRDRQFWGQDGGITLTGGEPLLQIDFTHEILSRCYDSFIHTAIETCGNVPWNNFKRVLPVTDWIFFDLKHFDNAIHEKSTGADNTQILENARALSENYKGRLIFRMPIIPGFNNSKENINSVIDFLKNIGRMEINILPLHHLGRDKYDKLNRKYEAVKYPVPSNEELRRIEGIFNSAGLKCYNGSETPF